MLAVKISSSKVICCRLSAKFLNGLNITRYVSSMMDMLIRIIAWAKGCLKRVDRQSAVITERIMKNSKNA